MAVAAVRIVPGKVLVGSEKLYTSPANTKTVIKMLTISNPTGGALSATVYCVPLGNAPGPAYLVQPAEAIAAGAKLIPAGALNQVLEAGGELWVDGAGLTVVASGVAIS